MCTCINKWGMCSADFADQSQSCMVSAGRSRQGEPQKFPDSEGNWRPLYPQSNLKQLWVSSEIYPQGSVRKLGTGRIQSGLAMSLPHYRVPEKQGRRENSPSLTSPEPQSPTLGSQGTLSWTVKCYVAPLCPWHGKRRSRLGWAEAIACNF